MAGDYFKLRLTYKDCSTSAAFAAADGNTTLIAGRANYTIYVQKIFVKISTSAAQAITFEDSNSSQKYVAKIPSAPGVDTQWTFDFGEEGEPLTSAKSLMMDMTAGNAGHVEVLAYFKPNSVVTMGNDN